MSIEPIVELIQTFGVPLGFALLFYFDIRGTKEDLKEIVKNNTVAILEMKATIEKVCDKLNHC